MNLNKTKIIETTKMEHKIKLEPNDEGREAAMIHADYILEDNYNSWRF